MNNRLIVNLIGKILMVESAFMVPALIVSFIYKENELIVFLLSIGITLLTGYLMSLVPVKKRRFLPEMVC